MASGFTSQSSSCLLLRKGVESSCQDALGHLLLVSTLPVPQQGAGGGVRRSRTPSWREAAKVHCPQTRLCLPLGNSGDVNSSTESGRQPSFRENFPNLRAILLGNTLPTKEQAPRDRLQPDN